MVEFGLCRRRKIWIAAAKFDKFCKRKFDKRRILFCAVFVYCTCVLRSWMLTIIVISPRFSGTLAFKTKANLVLLRDQLL